MTPFGSLKVTLVKTLKRSLSKGNTLLSIRSPYVSLVNEGPYGSILTLPHPLYSLGTKVHTKETFTH